MINVKTNQTSSRSRETTNTIINESINVDLTNSQTRNQYDDQFTFNQKHHTLP